MGGERERAELSISKIGFVKMSLGEKDGYSFSKSREINLHLIQREIKVIELLDGYEFISTMIFWVKL